MERQPWPESTQVRPALLGMLPRPRRLPTAAQATHGPSSLRIPDASVAPERSTTGLCFPSPVIQRPPMIPPTSMSEVPADHQGLGRAIPSFLRTKCAIKPVLCLLSSSPGDVALPVSLGGLVPPAERCLGRPVLLTACSQELAPRLSSLAQESQWGRHVIGCPLF